jgi:hypothetical protein
MRGMFYGPGGAFANVPNSTTSDAEGRFRYEGLPTRRLVFSATHPDFVEAARTLDTAADSTIDLTLSAGGSIAGQVLGRDQRAPVAGAVVSLQEQGASRGLDRRRSALGCLRSIPVRPSPRGSLLRDRAVPRAAPRHARSCSPRTSGSRTRTGAAGGAVIRGRVNRLAANSSPPCSSPPQRRTSRPRRRLGKTGCFSSRRPASRARDCLGRAPLRPIELKSVDARRRVRSSRRDRVRRQLPAFRPGPARRERRSRPLRRLDARAGHAGARVGSVGADR